MNDTIGRQAAFDALGKIPVREFKKTDGLLDALVSIGDVYMALKQLPSAQPEQRWISVTERLPEVGREVLVTMDDNETMTVGYVIENGWWYVDYSTEEHNDVIAWMPLVKPWKGDEASG